MKWALLVVLPQAVWSWQEHRVNSLGGGSAFRALVSHKTGLCQKCLGMADHYVPSADMQTVFFYASTNVPASWVGASIAAL